MSDFTKHVGADGQRPKRKQTIAVRFKPGRVAEYQVDVGMSVKFQHTDGRTLEGFVVLVDREADEIHFEVSL